MSQRGLFSKYFFHNCLDLDGLDGVDGFAAFQIARDIANIAAAAETPGLSDSRSNEPDVCLS